MKRKYQAEVVAPFSPILLKARIPLVLVQRIDAIASRAIRSPEERRRRNWAQNLAGNVRIEVRVTDLFKNDLDIMSFILSLGKSYGLRVPNILLGETHGAPSQQVTFETVLEEAWINDMVAGDYSPVHFHSGCQLSCVGFLRVPNSYVRERARHASNKDSIGCLQFIDSRTVVGASNMYLVRPEVGTFYMFPAWMLHCVYPFRGTGTRRSFSANISIRCVRKELKRSDGDV
jgi:Putative 2OG-Fe(II) oxygenase